MSPPPDAVIVAVAAIDRAYVEDRDPGGRRANYDRSIVAAIDAIARSTQRPVHAVFMPQLQSQAHDDAQYLGLLAAALTDGISREVLGGRPTSIEQRGVVASADVVIVGRYHPAVFAVSAEVPVLAVPYEHKAAGLMEAAGLSEFCIELDAVTPERLGACASELWERRDEVRDRLARTEPQLRASAARTSDLMAQLLR